MSRSDDMRHILSQINNVDPTKYFADEAKNFAAWGNATIVESYASKPPEVVYHGSKTAGITKFEYRDSVRHSTFDSHVVKSQGFFFAPDIEKAKLFGPHVGAYHITCNKPLISGTEGVDRIAPEKMDDVTYIFAALLEPEDDGGGSYDGYIHRVDISKEQLADPSGQWVYEFIGPGCIDWEYLDNAAFVTRMKERGYDSTMVLETHSPNWKSWFVLHPGQVKFLEMVGDDQDEDEDMYERAPNNPKAESFIRKRKKEFKHRYGKAWKRVLYATAWKRFGHELDE